MTMITENDGDRANQVNVNNVLILASVLAIDLAENLAHQARSQRHDEG